MANKQSKTEGKKLKIKSISIDDLLKYKQLIQELAMQDIDCKTQRLRYVNDKLLLFYLGEIMAELVAIKRGIS